MFHEITVEAAHRQLQAGAVLHLIMVVHQMFCRVTDIAERGDNYIVSVRVGGDEMRILVPPDTKLLKVSANFYANI
jgi:hypothetical protein